MERFAGFTESDMKAFEPEAKVGLIATVNQEGLPHITLITAIQARGPKELIWGQFSEGLSKKHVLNNPRTAFLIMTLDKSLWRGTALWREKRKEGAEFEMFNNKPMFRYNSYFGIHTVHYMDLVKTDGREKLPLFSIVISSLLTKAAKSAAGVKPDHPVLKTWAEGLFNRLDSLKFISWVGDDGFPLLVPLIQCQAASSGRLAFSPIAYGKELRALRGGCPVAVFGLTMDMEDILVRGVFRGPARFGPATLGTVDIDWVYNSMPPTPGQIYPLKPLEPVTGF